MTSADPIRDQRLREGFDALVEERDGEVLVRCVKSMHEGQFILWGENGHVKRMGYSESFVREAFRVRPYVPE